MRVEFLGIPRRRTGTDSCQVDGESLAEVWTELLRRYPSLCPQGPQSLPAACGVLLCLNGRRFVGDLSQPASADDTLLVLGADAGG